MHISNSVISCVLGLFLTRKNADNINTKIIAELANGPTTPDADQTLYEKGVLIIPDFLNSKPMKP